MDHAQEHHVVPACAERGKRLVHQVEGDDHQDHRRHHDEHRVVLDVGETAAPHRQREGKVSQDVDDAGHGRALR